MKKKIFIANLFVIIFVLTISCTTQQVGMTYEPRGQTNTIGISYAFSTSDDNFFPVPEYAFTYLPNIYPEITGSKEFGLGFDWNVMLPYHIGNYISIFPLIGFEGRYISNNNKLVDDELYEPLGLGINFGVGLDFSISSLFLLRLKALYQPEFTSWKNSYDGFRLNVAFGYRTKKDNSRKRITQNKLNNEKIKNELELASVCMEQKNYLAAITHYQNVLNINKNHVNAKSNLKIAIENVIEPENRLANASMDKGDFIAAIASYRNILKLNPNHTDAKNNLQIAIEKVIEQENRLASASMDKGDFTTAIASYRNILKLNPNHTDAKNNLHKAWVMRIAANQRLYPAPFVGEWKCVIKQATTKIEEVQVYDEGRALGLGRAHAYRTETRTVQVPEENAVLIFSGSTYTMNFSKGDTFNGTFFYSGNSIEFDDGSILQLNNNEIIAPSNFSGNVLRFKKLQ